VQKLTLERLSCWLKPRLHPEFGMARILLAEDNPADVYLIQEAMREHGVDSNIRVASDGNEVLELVSPGNPDAEIGSLGLIILDLNLPRHDGIEVLQRLRTNPALAHVPVVILTSSDSPRDRQLAQDLGATCYLRKPSNLERFLALGAVFKGLLGQTEAQGAV
jgi:CheY-like chemotaxis protein